jgi:hypothetical protein
MLSAEKNEGFVRNPRERDSQKHFGVHTNQVTSVSRTSREGRKRIMQDEIEHRLRGELVEAQESYRLANQRIIELLDEKIELEKDNSWMKRMLAEPPESAFREATLRNALDIVPAHLMLVNGPPYVLNLSEESLRQIAQAVELNPGPFLHRKCEAHRAAEEVKP